MTSETRILIEPTDIVALEFECKNCGARLTFKIPGKIDRTAEQCPNCNERFYKPDSYEGSDFNVFLRGVLAGHSLRINARVRLEVKDPIKPSVSQTLERVP